LRGVAYLRRADLVLYDYLVNAALLDHAPESAERVCLGHHRTGRTIAQPEVNRRMVDAAREGRTVVRLKSGDPCIFGRLAEELDALCTARIPCEIVPGITAGLAAPSYAPQAVPDAAPTAVTLITGHERPGKGGPPLDYARLARLPGSLVFYMGVTSTPNWSRALLDHGRSADTPVTIIRRVAWPEQEAIRTTLGQLAALMAERTVRPPAIVIVGDEASQ